MRDLFLGTHHNLSTTEKFLTLLESIKANDALAKLSGNIANIPSNSCLLYSSFFLRISE